jgi:hypothetical protein
MNRKQSAVGVANRAVNDAAGAMSFATLLLVAAALTDAPDAVFVSQETALRDAAENIRTTVEYEIGPS